MHCVTHILPIIDKSSVTFVRVTEPEPDPTFSQINIYNILILTLLFIA